MMVGDAPPQPTVGPAVPFANMGPNSLRQLSPSVDREALRAQRKAGSKRADGGVRHNRHLSPVQTRFTSSTPPRFCGVFRVSRPISPGQPGRTGINLLVTLHLSQLWSRCSVREHGPHSAAAAEFL